MTEPQPSKPNELVQLVELKVVRPEGSARRAVALRWNDNTEQLLGIMNVGSDLLRAVQSMVNTKLATLHPTTNSGTGETEHDFRPSNLVDAQCAYCKGWASDSTLSLECGWRLAHRDITEPIKASGSDNPPMSSNPSNTSNELDPNTLSLCNCDGLWHIGAPDRQPAVYLDDYVQSLLLRCRIDELKRLRIDAELTTRCAQYIEGRLHTLREGDNK